MRFEPIGPSFQPRMCLEEQSLFLSSLPQAEELEAVSQRPNHLSWLRICVERLKYVCNGYKAIYDSGVVGANIEFLIDIDPSDPRAINHVIVGDIGNQEILLAACDDGDVAAVSTRLIHLAAQRNIAVAQGAEDLHPEGIRPFFTGNVGQSAWGLAIHKEARLFAVSANTHNITIFAFALGGETLEESSSESDENVFDDDFEELIENADWNDLDGPPAPGQRASQNLQIVLSGHATNIPNIAFCNTDGDPKGKYLLSTDIEDRNYIWDIWEQKQICDFSFTENPQSSIDYYKGKHRAGIF